MHVGSIYLVQFSAFTITPFLIPLLIDISFKFSYEAETELENWIMKYAWISGRCWNRWSVCPDDFTAFNTGNSASNPQYMIGFIKVNSNLTPLFIFLFNIVSKSFKKKISYHCPYSKSRRIHFFLWNWECQVSSPRIIFARHWLLVILVHMEASLFHVVLQRKFFLLW